jgi:hypothetical protein
MNVLFYQLNEGWNAEPNAPSPAIEIQDEAVVLKFYVNPFKFHDFEEEEIGLLRFVRCERYRLGPTNDEEWYLGQCRFSKIAPKWGEFYAVYGDAALLDGPEDWMPIRGHSGAAKGPSEPFPAILSSLAFVLGCRLIVLGAAVPENTIFTECRCA